MTALFTDTVLHIAPTPFFSNRGCHIRIRNAVDAAKPYGFRSVVCTYHHGGSPPGMDIRRIPPVPGYTQTTAGYSPYKFIADALLFALVLATVKKERPRLIHAHLHEGALVGWAAGMLQTGATVPLLMDMQGSLSGELAAYGAFGGGSAALRAFRAAERLICRMPDAFVCSSTQGRQILEADFGVSRQRAFLLPDTVPPFFFDPPDFPDFKVRQGIPADIPVVIYTGSLLDGKGVAHLTDAMDRLLRDGQRHCFFVVVGYPADHLGAHVRKMGYADRCCLPGEVDYGTLPQWLSAADVAVEPKKADSGEASGKILHYLAAGLPVACFDSPFHRSVIGKAGYFAAPGDPKGLAGAIEQALADPDRAREKGAWGKAMARRRYALEAAGDGLNAVYRGLLSTGGKP